jgi:hypothetical protein
MHCSETSLDLCIQLCFDKPPHALCFLIQVHGNWPDDLRSGTEFNLMLQQLAFMCCSIQQPSMESMWKEFKLLLQQLTWTCCSVCGWSLTIAWTLYVWQMVPMLNVCNVQNKFWEFTSDDAQTVCLCLFIRQVKVTYVCPNNYKFVEQLYPAICNHICSWDQINVCALLHSNTTAHAVHSPFISNSLRLLIVLGVPLKIHAATVFVLHTPFQISCTTSKLSCVAQTITVSPPFSLSCHLIWWLWHSCD